MIAVPSCTCANANSHASHTSRCKFYLEQGMCEFICVCCDTGRDRTCCQHLLCILREFLIQNFHVWKVGWRQMVNLAGLKIFLLETNQKETGSAVISAAPASSELKGKRWKTLNFGEAFFWIRKVESFSTDLRVACRVFQGRSTLPCPQFSFNCSIF